MKADDFREKAHRCRLLLTTALRPDVKQQLRLWADELENLADVIETRPVAKVGAYKFCAPNSLKNNNCSHELN